MVFFLKRGGVNAECCVILCLALSVSRKQITFVAENNFQEANSLNLHRKRESIQKVAHFINFSELLCQLVVVSTPS